MFYNYCRSKIKKKKNIKGDQTNMAEFKLTEKGKDYSLGKLVVLADNNISKVINLNN